ncbi:MAG: L,D-transpeptidase family protein [Chitinophagaceae bacterium]
MKKPILFITACILLYCACRDGSPPKPGQAFTERDTSITRANACNDLFLDSSQVEEFIAQQQLNDTLKEDLRSFYNSRNFQFAWFSSAGLTEEALAFRNLYDYHNDSGTARKKLDRILDRMIASDSFVPGAHDKNTVKTELLLTWRFINYTNNTFTNAADRTNALLHLVPVKKQPLMQYANAVINNKEKVNDKYSALQQQLKKYLAIAEKGGWQTITTDKKKYKKGMSSPVVVQVKKRLQATGQLAGNDSTQLFDDNLEKAVKQAQSSFGQTADGIVTITLINALNVPVNTRIQQLLLNTERMRWMPATPSGKLIMVNIPEFRMHVMDGNQKVFDMNIVVGKEGHSTVLFNGRLNQVVFNPYWNIPSTIVRNEIIPAMNENNSYLEENNMEIVKDSQDEDDDLPVIRQLPGEKNALGKVKFLFPNSFNIYFHDTPEKSLFKKDKRAYSHGCIRLAEPVKLAQYVLQDNPQWTAEAITDTMNTGRQKFVTVKDPIPVLICYYTAWVDDNGMLQFRDDIYNHDTPLAKRLFI